MLQSLSELIGFSRRSGERTDELLTRFETVRSRAAANGQLQMSIPGITWILLKAIGINDTQLVQLLMPTGGMMPTTAAQYRDLLQRLRRMAHIIEHVPENIASQLRLQGRDPHH